MKTEINNKLIRSFVPLCCYDPIEIGIPDDESLSVKDWIEKYRNIVKEKQDVIWLICRNDFLSDRKLRLFAVWCAREALKLVKNPDERSINACNVAEKFAKGLATEEELTTANDAARDASTAAGDASAAARAACAASAARDSAREAWVAWAAASAARAASEAEDASKAWVARAASEASEAEDAWVAASAAGDAQINKLLTYLK